MDELLLEAQAIFDELVGAPPERQAALLEQRCGSRHELRSKVVQLLGATDEVMGDFLTPATHESAPPKRIGRYLVERQIGEGGMGLVYAARQESPDRVVALKLLRPGLVLPAWLRRFEHEIEVLATLQHPHIAHIYDAGTVPITAAGGQFEQPYFAMELVQGVPLTDCVRREALGVRDRLRLFVEVCEAVQYAHQKGVIHRDLKPANILVDETGRPKILDFGVARLTAAEVEAQTRVTTHGQLIGTPAYMSPEQLAGDAGRIDTRSDVYALGVIAYELLTDRPPIDVAGQLLPHAIRLLLEREPLRPSLVCPALRGDLDAILMRALEKDANRRYASAGELAADVRRHLRDEPITARPPRSWYILWKVVRRHRMAAALTAGLAVTLVASAIALGWLYRSAQFERARAERQATKALTVAALLEDALSTADPARGKGRAFTVVQMLDEFRAGKEESWEGSADVEATIRKTMGVAYRGLGEYEKADQQLRAALRVSRAEYGRGDPVVADVLYELAELLLVQGQAAEGEALAREALGLREDLLGPEHVAVAASLDQVGSFLQMQARYAEAEPLYRRALELRKRLLGAQHPHVAQTLNNLALLAHHRGDFAAAEPLYEEALRLRRAAYGDEHVDVADVLINRAALSQARARYVEAEAWYREALRIHAGLLGPDHPEQSWIYTGLGVVYRSTRRFAEAEQAYRQALGICERNVGDHRANVAAALTNLGILLNDLGQFGEAGDLHREALQLHVAQFGEDHPGTAGSRANLAAALRGEARYVEAEDQLRAARAILERLGASDHQRMLAVLGNRARLARDRGDGSQAERLFAEVVERLRQRDGHDHPLTLSIQCEWVAVLAMVGRHDEALELAERTLRSAESLVPADAALRAKAGIALGSVLSSRGGPADLSRGLDLLRQGALLQRQEWPEDHWMIGEAELLLAEALLRAERADEAQSVLEEARRILHAALVPQHALVARAERLKEMITWREDSPSTSTGG